MLIDTMKKDAQAEAIEAMGEAREAIQNLAGIINVLRDVVARPDESPDGCAISAETQIGIGAIVALVNEKYGGSIFNLYRAEKGLQKATQGTKEAA